LKNLSFPFIESGQPLDSNKKVVLIVEDNADLRHLVRMFLPKEEYTVLQSSGGADALSMLRGMSPPDLILLDFWLDDMSAAQLLLKLEKEMPELSERVPVVILTGLTDIPKTKAIGHIRKPFTRSFLLNQVSHFIDSKAQTYSQALES